MYSLLRFASGVVRSALFRFAMGGCPARRALAPACFRVASRAAIPCGPECFQRESARARNATARTMSQIMPQIMSQIMPQTTASDMQLFPSRAARLALFALMALFVAGCGGKRSIILQEPVTPQVWQSERRSPLDEGNDALKRGEMAAAERIFGMMTMRTDITPEERLGAWRGYSMAAEANAHPNLALDGLEAWRRLDPSADAGQQWQDIWYRAVSRTSRTESRQRAAAVFGDLARPWGLRTLAGLIVANRQWEGGDISGSLQTLSDLWAQAGAQAGGGSGGKPLRAALENRLLDELKPAEQATLDRLAATVTPENEGRYPYNIIALESARRMATANAGSLHALETLTRLQRSGNFTDPDLLGSVLAPLEQRGMRAARTVALALPMSGPFGNIGWKISRGAGAAQWELSRTGVDVEVVVLNTETPDWLDRLSALPPRCTVVGGPLRTGSFNAVRERGLTGQRAFFTFLPQLDGNDEGRVAWRFFTSPDDQIDALLQFTRDTLGVTGYGVLYPDEAFGGRMAALFAEQVRARGATVASSMSYPTGRHQEWNRIAGNFVKVRTVNKYPVPGITFEATFLPDSWKNTEMLAPNLFFHGEDRQVLLGTALWEQGLAGQKGVDVRNFGLAVFPGAWNSVQASPAGASLTRTLREAGNLDAPDFWVGLGYDFVRFATTLGLPEKGWTPAEVNRRLAHAQHMQWAMGALHWTADGRASQDLFLFTPAPDGFGPVEPAEFRRKLERTRARHEARVRAAATATRQ